MISIWGKKLERKYLVDLGFASGKEFTKEIIDSVVVGGVFLDAGCGESKFRNLLPDDVQYIGIDVHDGQNREEYEGWHHKPTIVADLHDIPLSSSSCDTVILLHVLEHVQSPQRVL